LHTLDCVRDLGCTWYSLDIATLLECDLAHDTRLLDIATLLQCDIAHDTHLTLLHCYFFALEIEQHFSCHATLVYPFGLGCLWNTPPINFVCVSGRCPYEVRVCFPSNRECNSHCPVSTHPSPPIVVTSHICSQNPSPMGLLARDFENCWV